MRSSRTEGGNVLFLILIAVALFAALSYAVTSSTRSSGGNADAEKIQTDMAVMMDYMTSLRQAVTRVMLSNHCSDEMIDAYSNLSVAAIEYLNLRAPTDESCHLFSPNGGNVIWQAPPLSVRTAGGTEYAIIGDIFVRDVGSNNFISTTGEELLAFTSVPRPMCLAINTRLHITNPGGEPPVQADWAPTIPNPGYSAFGRATAAGQPSNYGPHAVLGYDASDTPELAGMSSGCFYASSQGTYYFYDVLLPR